MAQTDALVIYTDEAPQANLIENLPTITNTLMVWYAILHDVILVEVQSTYQTSSPLHHCVCNCPEIKMGCVPLKWLSLVQLFGE